MRYLLLGGGGFIGQNIVRDVCAGAEIVIADKVPCEELTGLDGVSFRSFDFTTDDFTPLLDGVDVVFHLVSTVIPSEGTANIQEEIRDNILPTIRLLDACVQAKPPRLIFLSSGGTVYGEGEGCPLNETAPTDPICKYGVHKLAIEKYLRLYHVYHGLDYRIIRLSNPYSPKVYKNRLQGAVPIFIDKIIRNEPITIWGDGSSQRDYIHIRDVLSGIIAVLGYTGPQRTFNIGTGISTPLNELISLIAEALGRPSPAVNYAPKRNCDVADNKLDISLITECTGWTPRIPLVDGIRMCASEHRELR